MHNHSNKPSNANSASEKNLIGVVYQKDSSGFIVFVEGAAYRCPFPTDSIRANGHRKTKGRADPRAGGLSLPDLAWETLTVGDHVAFTRTGEASAAIIEVLPRRNQLSRRSAVPMPGAHAFEQVIAANLDLAVPVFAAAQPEPKWGMLDRYLVSAEAAEIPALICINKIDLLANRADKNGLLQSVEIYRRIGYPVVVISARTGEGLEHLNRALEGKVSAFLGKSGVGKTSLLNLIQPGLGQRVHEVSQATGKGRHTTTHLEMFPLNFGGAVVDTPGVREFGLWDIAVEELAWLFPEMRPMLGKCRFRLDCLHNEEPGCAVREAVTAGRISPFRYRSYVRLLEEP